LESGHYYAGARSFRLNAGIDIFKAGNRLADRFCTFYEQPSIDGFYRSVL
jgi:hypothetical protein